MSKNMIICFNLKLQWHPASYRRSHYKSTCLSNNILRKTQNTVLCVGDTAVGGPLMLFTSHVRLLSLSEACQLVAHFFVQSPWYLEQSAWSLSGKSFRGRKWLLRYNCTWKNWLFLQFNFPLGLFTEALTLKSLTGSFFCNSISAIWLHKNELQHRCMSKLKQTLLSAVSLRRIKQDWGWRQSVRARGGVQDGWIS